MQLIKVQYRQYSLKTNNKERQANTISVGCLMAYKFKTTNGEQMVYKYVILSNMNSSQNCDYC